MATLLNAEGYEIGHGAEINDKLHMGGYLSAEYKSSDIQDELELDDVALLLYGNLSSSFSYLLELEASPFYSIDFKDDTTTIDTKFHYERVYVDYRYSELLNIRVGKQITPIGYWNLEPINVLRDTSSSPLYSYIMFPKLLTGLDLYGYLDDEYSVSYHLFVQNSKDLDEEYTNIKTDYFIGVSLRYEVSDSLQFGGSAGRYKTIDDPKNINFVQINIKYDNDPWVVQSEVAYNDIEYTVDGDNDSRLSGYIQTKYNINNHHALIARYEYMDSGREDIVDHIAVIGYSYRPIYALSIKTEYQLNSDSDLNRAIVSLSVLF